MQPSLRMKRLDTNECQNDLFVWFILHKAKKLGKNNLASNFSPAREYNYKQTLYKQKRKKN